MNLVAFDFDQTMIHFNSDLVISDMLQDKPEELECIRKKDGWIAYMQGIFDHLHKRNITLEDIASVIKSLEAVPGMLELTRYLSEREDCTVIIISDANSFFIDTWLDHHNLTSHIGKVFTNPAQIIDGKLNICMYHLQDHCKLSSKNLCKGQVLQDYITEQKARGILYKKILYVGDGANDLCPMIRLNPDDVAFVRENYKCHELMKNNSSVKAKIVLWKSGSDILEFFKQ